MDESFTGHIIARGLRSRQSHEVVELLLGKFTTVVNDALLVDVLAEDSHVRLVRSIAELHGCLVLTSPIQEQEH